MGGLSKNKLRQAIAKIFHIASWKIALILVLLGFLAATLLRFDHVHMTELRDEVMAADEANDDERIVAALKQLHAFTLSHIIFNTVEANGQQSITFGTGPFYLENLYLRKANEAIAQAQAEVEKNTSNPNGNIYKRVADICDAQGIKYGWRYPDRRYIDCWTNELDKFPIEETMDVYGAATLPSTELFRYEYSSPFWYPCFSGIVILICVILTIILFVRLIIWLFLHVALLVVERSGKK